MGPESDVERMKTIYRAEREADRIVREAEEAAKALIAEAEAAAGTVLEAKTLEFARREKERRDREAAETEKEAQAYLERTRLQIAEWVRESESGIDAAADALLDRILPS